MLNQKDVLYNCQPKSKIYVFIIEIHLTYTEKMMQHYAFSTIFDFLIKISTIFVNI